MSPPLANHNSGQADVIQTALRETDLGSITTLEAKATHQGVHQAGEIVHAISSVHRRRIRPSVSS